LHHERGRFLSSANQRRESPRRKLEVDPMFKKILITAATLSAMMFGASAANAHYNSHGYNYGYSYNYRPAYSYSYSSYQPSCYYKSIPVTIRVWNEYYCEYTYKTVYRSVKSCY
jgi:hypothetical protein